MTDAQEFTLTVLLENATIDDNLEREHGLSFCLNGPDWQIVFDTGQSGMFVRNAAYLGIDLSKTTELVLSHGHYDHTGGLVEFFDIAPKAKVFCHPQTVIQRYSIKDMAFPRMIGIPDDCRNALEEHLYIPVTGPVSLNKHVNLTGPIPRRNSYEDVGGPFYLDAEGKRPDPITDDQAIWFTTDKGLVIILGCAHAGIINTIHTCIDQSGVNQVHALIGGFHLVNAGSNRMENTIAALMDIAPAQLAACHCTGANAIGQLKCAFPNTFSPCHSGSVFRFQSSGQ